DHFVAEVREARGGGEADVAGAHDGDTHPTSHRRPPPLPEVARGAGARDALNRGRGEPTKRDVTGNGTRYGQPTAGMGPPGFAGGPVVGVVPAAGRCTAIGSTCAACKLTGAETCPKSRPSTTTTSTPCGADEDCTTLPAPPRYASTSCA